MYSFKPQSSLEQLMREEFESCQNSDIEVHAGGTIFRVNKTFLFMQSSVFRAMFSHDSEESCTNVIKITGFDADLIRKFLLYFYIKKIDDLSADAVEMYELSDYYNVTDLSELCLQSMYANLNSSNVIDYFEMGYKFELVELRQKCFEFMWNNITLGTTFDYYDISKKYQMGSLENKVVHFIKLNAIKLAKREEWEKFDPEFRLQMFQEFAEQTEILKRIVKSEGVVHLEIPNFGKFIHDHPLGKKTYSSIPVFICGLTWQLVVRFQHIVIHKVSFELIGNEEDFNKNNDSEKWLCKAIAGFQICSQRSGKNSYVKHVELTNWAPKKYYWSDSFSCDFLLSEENGFVKNDTICFEAHIKVEKTNEPKT